VAQNYAESAASPQADTSAGESLSRFITRILDQLSLSSWLPAIMLVCNCALLLQLHAQHDLNLGAAIIALTRKPLGILIVLLLAIILVSVITQAFEFEVIRIFEGYWGSVRVLDRLSRRRTRHHLDRLIALERRYAAYQDLAFASARATMRTRKLPRDIVTIIDRQTHRKRVDHYDRARIAEAAKVNWRQYAAPELLRQMDAAMTRIRQHPEPHRILPTRLGNTLRAAEDGLTLAPGENLEEFVYRRYPLMTAELKSEHDRYRSQLNIYCLSALIFACLAVLVPAALVHRRAELPGELCFALAYAALAFVSYRAAVASAHGYVTVLRVLGSQPAANPAATPASS